MDDQTHLSAHSSQGLCRARSPTAVPGRWCASPAGAKAGISRLTRCEGMTVEEGEEGGALLLRVHKWDQQFEEVRGSALLLLMQMQGQQIEEVQGSRCGRGTRRWCAPGRVGKGVADWRGGCRWQGD